MNEEKLARAVKEAKRFLRSAKALKAARSASDYRWAMFPKESGACRRSSMDLTRALADARRPN